MFKVIVYISSGCNSKRVSFAQCQEVISNNIRFYQQISLPLMTIFKSDIGKKVYYNGKKINQMRNQIYTDNLPLRSLSHSVISPLWHTNTHTPHTQLRNFKVVCYATTVTKNIWIISKDIEIPKDTNYRNSDHYKKTLDLCPNYV